MPGVERVTLMGRLTRADDQPATGYVQVRVLDTEQVRDEDGVILTTQPVRIRLVDGEFATLVPVTDDPETPRWIVVDLLPDDTAPEQLVFTVDGTVDPVDLADVVSVPVVPDSDGHTVAVPWELVGRAGGVAPLNEAGKVPLQFLPAGQGGDAPFRRWVQDPGQAAFIVQHNFGRPASVDLFSLDESERFEGYQVAQLDLNRVRISMDVPTACVALIR